AGEPVTLTSHGEPIADLVPHRRRARWLPGRWLREQLGDRQADPALRRHLDHLAGGAIDELSVEVWPTRRSSSPKRPSDRSASCPPSSPYRSSRSASSNS